MLHRLFLAALLVLPCATSAAAQSPQPAAPPVAATEPVQDTYFGTTVTDPYRWMEKLDAPQVKSWFRGQADYTQSVLSRIPGRAALLARLQALDNIATSVGGVQEDGPYVFYIKRRPQDNNFKLYVRRGISSPERLLFDPEALAGSGAHSSIDFFTPSQDGAYVAYGTSPGGSEDSTIHVLETATGKVLPDAISRTQFSGSDIGWLPDGRSFLYNRLQKLAPGQNPADKESDSHACRHRLGDDPDTQDTPILGKGVSQRTPFEDADVPYLLTSPAAPDTVFGINERGVQNELTLWAAPVASLSGDAAQIPWVKVCDAADGVTTYDVHAGRLYLLSHKNAPHFQVLAVDLAAPDLAHAQVVVAASQTVLRGLGAASDALYLHGLRDGLGVLTRVPYGTGNAQPIRLPFVGALNPIVVTDPRLPGALFETESGTHSPALYRYDPATARVADTGLQPRVPADFSHVVQVETYAVAPDGTHIPLSILYPKGMKFDGSHPLFLDGYGAYSITEDLFFWPSLLAWIERGGVYAVAHVRGGGEGGQDWYQAGYKATKPNTWRDFNTCAQFLVNHKYTSPAHLAGEGTSAGGILISRAITERPDLWRVAVIRVGWSDMLRTEFSPNGPDNVPEFGSVTTPQGFKDLYAMDGYQHVQNGVRYPAVLLTTGINDPRVTPYEPAKMTARLQAVAASLPQSARRPVLLRVDYDSGHGFGTTKSQLQQELADDWSFALWQFGQPGFQPEK